MPIDLKIYDTDTLLGVMEELEPMSSYWLDLCFNSSINFDTKYIDFEKITNKRKLAPFVAPSAQGRPLAGKGSQVTRFEPAYVKPKDAVDPARQISRRPGELLRPTPMSPLERYNAAIADIMAQHRDAILRREEWLAAQAIINGTVTIADEDYPERTIDFGRAAGHTITLGSGSRFGDNGVDILAVIEGWRTTVRRAAFGGPTNRLTVGPAVWDVMRKDANVLKQLDTQLRGTTANLNTGIREGADVEYVGKLSGTLDVYVYSDYYQQSNGDAVAFMHEKDIVLTGQNVMGVRCYGAILDQGAQLRPMQMFPKMWDENDPPVTFCMTQSAPLMVPVNPNNTLKARVLG